MKSVAYITILGLPVSIFGRQGHHGGAHISSVPPLGLESVASCGGTATQYIEFLYVQETWRKSFMFPYYHGRNLFNQMKANTISIWRGEELPEEPQQDKLYGHCIMFFETMTESLMQLCLKWLIKLKLAFLGILIHQLVFVTYLVHLIPSQVTQS